MTQSRVVRVFTAAAAAFTLFALTGCAEKVTSPDASYTTLEGVQTNQLVMVGYQQPALTESHWLVATTDNATPFYSSSTPIAPDSTGRNFGAIVDQTVSDGVQVYRSSNGGGLAPIHDYPLRPFIKVLPEYRDLFLFDDPDAAAGTTEYVARGTLEGRVSKDSPVSNVALATGTLDETMLASSATRFRDSLGTFSWTTDPRAVFYIVNVLDYGEVSGNRTMASRCSYPTPFYPDPTVTQTVLVTTGNSLSFDMRGQRFPIRKLVRVAAVDANYRIVNRLNPGAATLNTQPPAALDAYKFRFTEEAPANFNAFVVYTHGGAKVVFDPFNQDVGMPHRGDGALASTPVDRANRQGVVTKGLTPAEVHALVARKGGRPVALSMF